MSPIRMWEVIGQSSQGGLVVREGKELTSRKEPWRLGTGSIIRQLRLEGDRLQYLRISGLGPMTGWVSVRVHGQGLVVRTVRESGVMPICMCFCTLLGSREVNRSQMVPFMSLARRQGLEDFVMGDHACEEGYLDCKDFDEYTTRLASKLDEDPSNQGRPVFIVAHGAGAVPAWGTAVKLGRRCLKLYVVGRRPPTTPMLDDVFGVDTFAKIHAIDDRTIFTSICDAWPNPLTDAFTGGHPAPWELPACAGLSDLIRRLYGSSISPYGSKDNHLICKGKMAISAPIMALAAEKENPDKGETPEKMQDWKYFTQRAKSFELAVVPDVDHLSIMWMLSPALSMIIDDMRCQLAKRAWMKKEAPPLANCASN